MKKQALIQFLGIENQPEEIEEIQVSSYNDNIFEYYNQEYEILTDGKKSFNIILTKLYFQKFQIIGKLISMRKHGNATQDLTEEDTQSRVMMVTKMK